MLTKCQHLECGFLGIAWVISSANSVLWHIVWSLFHAVGFSLETLILHFIFLPDLKFHWCLKIYKVVSLVLQSSLHFVYSYFVICLGLFMQSSIQSFQELFQRNYITACQKLAFGKSQWEVVKKVSYSQKKRQKYSCTQYAWPEELYTLHHLYSLLTCLPIRPMHSSMRGSFCIPRREL